MTRAWQSTIYAGDARTVLRTTSHDSHAQARRSLRDYERQHGRHSCSIDRAPAPHCSDAAGWDRYRLAHGIASRG